MKSKCKILLLAAILLLPLQTFSFAGEPTLNENKSTTAAYQKWIVVKKTYRRGTEIPEYISYNDGFLAGRLQRRNIVSLNNTWVTYEFSGYCHCISDCPSMR